MREPEPPVIPAGASLDPAVFTYRGQSVTVPLRQPGWQARSDHVAALIDGEWQIITARSLLLHMAGKIHRPLSRKRMAELF